MTHEKALATLFCPLSTHPLVHLGNIFSHLFDHQCDQKVFASNLVSNFKRKVFVSKPVSKFLVSFHVKPRVEYYVFESNHVSRKKISRDFLLI